MLRTVPNFSNITNRVGKPCELITECSRVLQLSEYHYCGTLLHSVIDLQGFPKTRRLLGWWVCLSFPTKPAMISNVWCLEICPGTLFLILLKFGAVLSVIYGLLIAIYTWIHVLQCIVFVRSFLRMLNLRKLAVRKLYFSRGVVFGVNVC